MITPQLIIKIIWPGALIQEKNSKNQYNHIGTMMHNKKLSYITFHRETKNPTHSLEWQLQQATHHHVILCSFLETDYKSKEKIKTLNEHKH